AESGGLWSLLSKGEFLGRNQGRSIFGGGCWFLAASSYAFSAALAGSSQNLASSVISSKPDRAPTPSAMAPQSAPRFMISTQKRPTMAPANSTPIRSPHPGQNVRLYLTVPPPGNGRESERPMAKPLKT